VSRGRLDALNFVERYAQACSVEQVEQGRTTADFRIWRANITFSPTATFVCAAISWRLLEKPLLDNWNHAVAAVERAVS
jgi:hypothetical protein